MLEPDLKQLSSITTKNAFKNNAVYQQVLNISGSTGAGLNIREFDVKLDKVPDLVSALFNGPTDTIFGGDPRPGTAWFKKGAIWVLGSNPGAGYIDYPTPWRVTVKIVGGSAVIRLTYIQQFTDGLTLNPTNFSYRIIDYSVF